MILTAFKVALIVAVSGPLVFAADYTRLTRWKCWRDQVGQTVIIEAVFLALSLAPLLLAGFFHLSTLGSEIGAWTLIGFLFASGLVMYWRTWVFERIARKRRNHEDG